VAEKTHFGLNALRGRGAQDTGAPESDVTRHTTGMPEKPKPGWWPDSTHPGTKPGEDANLHVGRGLRLKGEVSACDRLMVEGDVEATISARILEISATGRVKGSAEVETAEIDGRFDGQLTVSGCLTVRRSGHVSGTIVYDTLEVEKGGCITGDLVRTGGAQADAAPVIELTPPEGAAVQN